MNCEHDMIQGWKFLTHDNRPPIQGGDPLFPVGAELPLDLPKVWCDISAAECGRGWNFVDDIAKGIKIAKLWPTGRPSAIYRVQAHRAITVKRSDKLRASELTVLRPATREEIAAGIADFSKVFGEFANDMTQEQMAWFEALGRPEKNEKAMVASLEVALAKRSLNWSLKKFGDARDARAARAARAALTVFFAAKKKWVTKEPDFLTIGLREAYKAGLEIAIPTGPNELGFVMSE